VTVELVRMVDERLRAEAHRVIGAVVALGGAVGYLEPPPRLVTDRWLDDVVSDAVRNDGALAVARLDGRLAALGSWRRGPNPVTAITATVEKVMAAPDARGRGLARAVVEALVGDAARAGVEVLTLGVRGNNHRARRLYEGLGFVVWGVLPNALRVGERRFDDVRMLRELERPAGLQLVGSRAEGPGSSV
jgi:ribosomal protein S18 acetylase RimI-like enzyme